MILFYILMHEHGYFDKTLQQWFCGYFMDKEEWLDIHDYSPENPNKSNDSSNNKEKSNI